MPHDGRLATRIARNWINNRDYGFASFGWTFESFIQRERLPRRGPPNRRVDAGRIMDGRIQKRNARTIVSRSGAQALDGQGKFTYRGW